MKNNKEAQEYILKKAADYRNSKKQIQKKLFITTLSLVILIPVVAVSLSMNSFNPNPIVIDQSEMAESSQISISEPAPLPQRIVYANSITLPFNLQSDWVLPAGAVIYDDDLKEALENPENQDSLFYVLIKTHMPYHFDYKSKTDQNFLVGKTIEGYGTRKTVTVEEYKSFIEKKNVIWNKIDPYFFCCTDYYKPFIAPELEKIYKELVEESGLPVTWEENDLTADSDYFEIEKVLEKEKEIWIELDRQYWELWRSELHNIYLDGLESLKTEIELQEVDGIEGFFIAYIKASDIEIFKTMPFAVELKLLTEDVSEETIRNHYYTLSND